jgi:hypothetical protein
MRIRSRQRRRKPISSGVVASELRASPRCCTLAVARQRQAAGIIPRSPVRHAAQALFDEKTSHATRLLAAVSTRRNSRS